MELKFKNLIYVSHINAIGGIETFLYNLALQLHDKVDLTILYKIGDKAQIDRLKPFIRVLKYQPGMTFCVENAMFNYDIDLIDKITANEYIQVIHGDYKALGVQPKLHPLITKVVGVSQLVCDTYEELTGIKPVAYYNPISIKKPARTLRLISATRLTSEKGKHRIEKMIKKLDSSKIPYIWTIFTNDTEAIESPNIIWKKPTLDITPHIVAADYLVQLSDSESYGYSIVESLSVGTPVIVTDMPILKEIGVKHEENGFIVDFNLNDLDVDQIYNTYLNFDYSAPTSNWADLFYESEPTYKEDMGSLYVVEALITYAKYKIKDKTLDRIPTPGERFVVDFDRLQELMGLNSLSKPFVKLIGRADFD